MAIPSVVQGTIETEDGKVFELDSAKGLAWLESIGSFRFEPSAANKPYTVRKESGKGSDYWYGYRKVAGKLHKKYIGKSSEVSAAKLEEIAESLNTPPQPRVNARDMTGKFAVKSETPRKVRSVNLTDAAWEWLARTAEQAGMSRNDFLEAMAESNEPVTNFSPKVEPRDTEVDAQIEELQAEVKALHQDIRKTQKAVDLVSSKLADLTHTTKVAK